MARAGGARCAYLVAWRGGVVTRFACSGGVAARASGRTPSLSSIFSSSLFFSDPFLLAAHAFNALVRLRLTELPRHADDFRRLSLDRVPRRHLGVPDGLGGVQHQDCEAGRETFYRDPVFIAGGIFIYLPCASAKNERTRCSALPHARVQKRTDTALPHARGTLERLAGYAVP